jgi:hypothetical protein
VKALHFGALDKGGQNAFDPSLANEKNPQESNQG